MAYNGTAAYDLNLFDEDISFYNSSAAPKRRSDDLHKQSNKKKSKAKVLTIEEDDLNKIRRRKHTPLKLALGSLCGAVAAVIIGFIIVGQVQLTELNQEIINAEALLADSQSVYTQNQMKLESKLTNDQIESYAEDVLGMTKASNAQKEFVALSIGDKAEVSVEDNGNVFTQFFDSISNLWS